MVERARHRSPGPALELIGCGASQRRRGRLPRRAARTSTASPGSASTASERQRRPGRRLERRHGRHQLGLPHPALHRAASRSSRPSTRSLRRRSGAAPVPGTTPDPAAARSTATTTSAEASNQSADARQQQARDSAAEQTDKARNAANVHPGSGPVKRSDRMILIGVALLALLAAFCFLVVAPKREELSELDQESSRPRGRGRRAGADRGVRREQAKADYDRRLPPPRRARQGGPRRRRLGQPDRPDQPLADQLAGRLPQRRARRGAGRRRPPAGGPDDRRAGAQRNADQRVRGRGLDVGARHRPPARPDDGAGDPAAVRRPRRRRRRCRSAPPSARPDSR